MMGKDMVKRKKDENLLDVVEIEMEAKGVLIWSRDFEEYDVFYYSDIMLMFRVKEKITT